MDLGKIRIVIDTREKKSGIPKLLANIGIKVETKTLLVGDYIVGPEIIIERKSVHDLISSVFDGRLFDQCNRLKQHFMNPILLVEGDVKQIEDLTENPLIFYGALSSVALEFKIPIIHTPSAEHTAKMLVAMCTRKENSKGPFLKKIRKSNDVQQQQLSILSSLPGVGEKLAIRILERMQTPIQALTSTSTDLGKIPGVGPKRAKRIHDMLHTPNKHAKSDDQSRLDD